MTVRLLSIGTATPRGQLTQGRTSDFGRAMAPGSVPEGVIEGLYRRTKIDRRGSVLIDPATGGQTFYTPDTEGGGPTTAARMAVYAREAAGLACEAAAAAVARAGVAAASITQVVTVSCTGFESPGVDQMLVRGLGLRASVGRTHIGFMGCHGALNGLAVARALAATDAGGGAVVLLCCVELCSLHMHYGDRMDQLIANALFADGAGAAIVASSDRAEFPEVRACRSWLAPDSSDLMSWRIGNHGFEMSLSPQVPSRLAAVVPGWMDSVLESCDPPLRRADIAGWAIHPGGAKIVEAVGEALGLRADAAADSLAVLREHGNMSSPTVLFILDRMMQGRRARPWVAMAFGPGLAAEAVVFG